MFDNSKPFDLYQAELNRRRKAREAEANKTSSIIKEQITVILLGVALIVFAYVLPKLIYFATKLILQK